MQICRIFLWQEGLKLLAEIVNVSRWNELKPKFACKQIEQSMPKIQSLFAIRMYGQKD